MSNYGVYSGAPRVPTTGGLLQAFLQVPTSTGPHAFVTAVPGKYISVVYLRDVLQAFGFGEFQMEWTNGTVWYHASAANTPTPSDLVDFGAVSPVGLGVQIRRPSGTTNPMVINMNYALLDPFPS